MILTVIDKVQAAPQSLDHGRAYAVQGGSRPSVSTRVSSWRRLERAFRFLNRALPSPTCLPVQILNSVGSWCARRVLVVCASRYVRALHQDDAVLKLSAAHYKYIIKSISDTLDYGNLKLSMI